VRREGSFPPISSVDRPMSFLGRGSLMIFKRYHGRRHDPRPRRPCGLGPSKDLFHQLALALADVIPGVPRRSVIDRTAAVGPVLSDVGRDAEGAERCEEPRDVAALVSAGWRRSAD